MVEPQPSAWAQERFGAAATELSHVVPLAIHRAHELAMAAHVSSTLTSNDAYGSTLAVTQHLQLAGLAKGIPGVAVRKPADVRSRYEFVVLDETAVVLYPWRYATDPRKAREDAKLRSPVSDLRKNLLTLTARTIDPQLSLDQAELDPAQLAAEIAEEEAVLEQLAKFGQVVTIGYASNPAVGIFGLGCGDAELVDKDTGAVAWHHWEPLARGGQAGGTGTREPWEPLNPVNGPDRAGRFDDAPLNDDFGLIPRSPLAEPPISEPERRQRSTESDDPE